MVFGNSTEQNRRIAVKKTKKKSSELEGFKVCSGHFSGGGGPASPAEYSLNLNDFNALLRGRRKGSSENNPNDEEEEEEDEDDGGEEDNYYDKQHPNDKKTAKNKNYFHVTNNLLMFIAHPSSS